MAVSETVISELIVLEMKKSNSMRFYNREKELSRLQQIKSQSLEHAQMTVVTGRRRIGKTQLLLKSTEEDTTLYFFVARKSESFLCQDFQREIAERLNVPIIGEITNFSEIFRYLMQLSKERPFNLIIDEFQEFMNINPSICSDMQRLWDLNKDDSRINLLLSGSIYSMMHKIFENSDEPLFGRATAMLRVKPFETKVLKDILFEYYPKYTAEDLLALYTFTGGVAKYVQLFMDNKAYTLKAMINLMIQEDSLFISEGKNILIEEFGKDYATYFTILSSIARGENTRAKIEAVVKREIGGYLTKLEHDYDLISKNIPIFAKVETKNVRYTLDDNFLTFWFRFIYKYSYLIEIEQYDQLKNLIIRDYPTFSGKMLEKYFRMKLIEEKKYSRLGGFWDRKGENEIDLVAVNELDNKMDVIEIKRNADNFDKRKLHVKGSNFLKINGEFQNYTIDYRELSMNDM